MSKKFLRTDENGRIQLIHNMPFDVKEGLGKTEAELLEIGFLIDEVPEPDRTKIETEGKIGVAYYTNEKGFWYEYIDRPKEPIDELKDELKATQEALDFVLMNQTEGGTM